MAVPLIDSFAAIAPRFSGSISACSSSIVIYLIFRSDAKLSTIYHRIMFAMSSVDIMSSIAIALTTLPMPRDLTGYNHPYDWAGTRLGNVHTCSAQGFFVVFGTLAMFAYNGSLCFYYTCVIAFEIKEQTILRYVEPFLHVIPLGYALVNALYPLFYENYNPTGWEAWCTIASGNGRGSDRAKLKRLYKIGIPIVISFILGFIFICFVLIIRKAVRLERALKRSQNNRNSNFRRHGDNFRLEEDRTRSANVKVVVVQAVAYCASFLLTLLTPLLRNIYIDENIYARIQVVVMPLQGFFNGMIFIYHKVYNFRRVHSDVSRCEVLRLLFKGSANDDLLLSRISFVSTADDDSENQQHHNREESASENDVVLGDEENGSRSHLSGFSIGSTTNYPSSQVQIEIGDE